MALGFRFYVTSAECTSFIFKIVDAEKLIYTKVMIMGLKQIKEGTQNVLLSTAQGMDLGTSAALLLCM